jgi:hypothetical protein
VLSVTKKEIEKVAHVLQFRFNRTDFWTTLCFEPLKGPGLTNRTGKESMEARRYTLFWVIVLIDIAHDIITTVHNCRIWG